MLQEGPIECSILPPKRLYHPVMPFRCKTDSYSACAERVPPNSIQRQNALGDRLRKGTEKYIGMK